MQSLKAPHSLKYNLTPVTEGVLLSIWEPAPVTEQRARPFLFMAKHRLPSEDEAQEILNYYLSAYEAMP
jgi:hypothetical protein